MGIQRQQQLELTLTPGHQSRRDGYVEWTRQVLQEFAMCCTLITTLTNQAVITGILPVADNCLILLFESHQDLNSWQALPASQTGIAWPVSAETGV